MRIQVFVALLPLVAPVFSSPTPGGGGSDCNKTVKPGQSIQKAINNARPGDKITVEAGTYAEQLTITKSDITLIGKNAVLVPPKTFTKNLCSGLNKDFAGIDTEAGICIHGKNVQLAEFKQEHRKFISAGEYVKNVAVTGFKVKGFSGENIAVVAGKNVQVTKNKLIDGSQYGFLTVGSKNTLAEANTVESSTAAVLFIAMCMDDQSDARFKENDISGYIIALCTQTPGGEVKRNKVKNCCIGPFVDPGIQGAKVIGNTITNRNPACPSGEGSPGAGIIVWGASNTIIEKNTIEYINNNQTGVGILISDDPVTGTKASGNVVKKNSLKFNDVDIFNSATTTDNVFANNKCTTSAPGDYCD
ncbi:Nn.00g045610.m01.CDS01 [Neocucurbitaria sp. VM-36]